MPRPWCYLQKYVQPTWCIVAIVRNEDDMIGKRKGDLVSSARPAPESNGSSGAVTEHPNGTSEEIFRRYFEARFEPLPDVALTIGQSTATTESGDDDAHSYSDWSGISDNEGDTRIPLIEHSSSAQPAYTDGDKVELRSFMVSLHLQRCKSPLKFRLSIQTSKPPTTPHRGHTAEKKAENDDEADEATDAMLLKKDLALQRLLRESHLLETLSSSAPTGHRRHKATDLRLRSLGSRVSIFEQEKMPMSHRRGIRARAAQQEASKRREALENGIILERSTKPSKAGANRRERGIGGPAVGKFSGGTLKLSQRDVDKIKGPRYKMRGSRKS